MGSRYGNKHRRGLIHNRYYNPIGRLLAGVWGRSEVDARPVVRLKAARVWLGAPAGRRDINVLGRRDRFCANTS